jgi:hypothetical protein
MLEAQEMQLIILENPREKRPLIKSKWDDNKWKHEVDCSDVAFYLAFLDTFVSFHFSHEGTLDSLFGRRERGSITYQHFNC